jgi:phosphatidylinositol-3,4,5-trisphosphate 3-phosphatase and dual-specificity protein phosphatase PTEN
MSYITEQIIAMGFPSEGFEARYRNSITDVVEFFNYRHKQSYKIYNLCSERKYEQGYFEKGTINEKYGFDDHNPPPFDLIFDFCVDCYNFLI